MEERKKKTNKQYLVAMVTDVEGISRSSHARGAAQRPKLNWNLQLYPQPQLSDFRLHNKQKEAAKMMQ